MLNRPVIVRAVFAIAFELRDANKGRQNHLTTYMYGEDFDAFWYDTQKYNFDFTFVNDDSCVWEVIFVDERNSQGQDSFKVVETRYSRKSYSK